MANYGRVRVIEIDELKKFASERDALDNKGFSSIGVFTSKIGNQVTVRQIFEDPDNKSLWAFITADVRGYNFKSITLKEFIGSPDKIQ